MSVTRGSGPAALWDYGYDALDRLTSLTGTASNSSYGYDEVGNLLTKGALPAFEYGDPAKPYAVTRIGSTKYTYDAAGNRVEKGTCSPVPDCTSYTPTETYAFDAAGRMSSFTNVATGETTSYRYGPGGQRIRISGPGGTRRIFGPLVETLDSASEEVDFYYAGPIRIAMKGPSGTYWYHHDHLGSVRLMTDAAGEVVATNDFMPFGESLASTGSDGANPYDFAGHRTETESGLIYMNARYYDPVMGRFISPDQVVPDVLNPQSLNPYAYAYNNPISNTDPTGHLPVALAVAEIVWFASVSFIASTWLTLATGSPLAASILGIVLGFAGGYGLVVGEVALGLGGGILGGGASWLSSPYSPLGKTARQIVGWTWTAVGLIIAAYSVARACAQARVKTIVDAANDASRTAGAKAKVTQSGVGRAQTASVTSEGGTIPLWRACNGGDAGACSDLEAINAADLHDALEHIESVAPAVIKRAGDPTITFDGSEAFFKATSGSTDPITGDITLARGYVSKADFVGTVAEELMHSGDGIFGRGLTNLQDRFFPGPPYGVGSWHTAIKNRANAISDEYGP